MLSKNVINRYILLQKILKLRKKIPIFGLVFGFNVTRQHRNVKATRKRFLFFFQYLCHKNHYMKISDQIRLSLYVIISVFYHKHTTTLILIVLVVRSHKNGHKTVPVGARAVVRVHDSKYE